MDGWTANGRMDGWMKGGTDGQDGSDGWMDDPSGTQKWKIT